MHQQRIVIVGGGIIGLATAYHLLRTGSEQVTVLEQATIDHERASSHGDSRMLRFEYGDDSLYSSMVQLSLQRWREFEQTTSTSLYTPTGILIMSSPQDSFARTSYQALRKSGMAIEQLTSAECARRFPQFATRNFDFLTYNNNAGMLHASASLRTLRQCIIALGGIIREHTRVIHIDNRQSQESVHLHTRHEVIDADRVVVAAGPWVHSLLGGLALPVRLTRQYLLYFSQLDEKRYSVPQFPAFFADDLYGFPLHRLKSGEPLYLKAASHVFGAQTNPEERPSIDQSVISQVTQHLYTLLPELAQAKLAKIEAYIYDVSSDEDFIMDYMPQDHRIVLATGLTGHAFKFGLLLGEMITSLLRETRPVVPMERFSLHRFTPPWKTPSNVA